MISKTIRRTNRWGRTVVAASVAAVYLFTNVVTAYAGEQSFWNARRAATQRMRETDAAPAGVSDGRLLLAQLPHAAPVDLSRAVTGTQPVSAAKTPFVYGPKAGDWLGKVVMPYGSVREFHLADKADAPFIVHIQDAHGIEEAQRNIAAMVGLLAEDPGITLVGLEGATGAFSLDKFHKYPKNVMKDIADLFLKKDLIAGPEFAGLTLAQSPSYFGAEDQTLYDANVAALKTAFQGKTEAQNRLAKVQKEIAKLKAAGLSNDLKDYDQHFESYHARKEKLADYVHAVSQALLKGKNPPSTPNLNLLVVALKQENALDFKRVESDRRDLINRLVARLASAEIQQLVAESLDCRAGRLGYGEYHARLRQICLVHGISLKEYPSLSAYIDYVVAADKIDHHGLLTEMDAVERYLPAALARTPRERDLISLSQDLTAVAKLVRHEMSATDWSQYETRQEEFHRLGGRLAELTPVTDGVETLTPETLKPFEEFCLFAVKRNEALTKNLLRQVSDTKAKGAVLVAGGFHTEGLTALLRGQQASYVVITPKITAIPAENNYLNIFANDPVPLEKQLAGDRIYLTKPIGMRPNGPSDSAATALAQVATGEEPQATTTDGKTTFSANPKPGDPAVVIAGQSIGVRSTQEAPKGLMKAIAKRVGLSERRVEDIAVFAIANTLIITFGSVFLAPLAVVLLVVARHLKNMGLHMEAAKIRAMIMEELDGQNEQAVAAWESAFKRNYLTSLAASALVWVAMLSVPGLALVLANFDLSLTAQIVAGLIPFLGALAHEKYSRAAVSRLGGDPSRTGWFANQVLAPLTESGDIEALRTALKKLIREQYSNDHSSERLHRMMRMIEEGEFDNIAQEYSRIILSVNDTGKTSFPISPIPYSDIFNFRVERFTVNGIGKPGDSKGIEPGKRIAAPRESFAGTIFNAPTEIKKIITPGATLAPEKLTVIPFNAAILDKLLSTSMPRRLAYGAVALWATSIVSLVSAGLFGFDVIGLQQFESLVGDSYVLGAMAAVFAIGLGRYNRIVDGYSAGSTRQNKATLERGINSLISANELLNIPNVTVIVVDRIEEIQNEAFPVGTINPSLSHEEDGSSSITVNARPRIRSVRLPQFLGFLNRRYVGTTVYDSGRNTLYVQSDLARLAEQHGFLSTTLAFPLTINIPAYLKLGFALAHEKGKYEFSQSRFAQGPLSPLIAEVYGYAYEVAYGLSELVSGLLSPFKNLPPFSPWLEAVAGGFLFVSPISFFLGFPSMIAPSLGAAALLAIFNRAINRVFSTVTHFIATDDQSAQQPDEKNGTPLATTLGLTAKWSTMTDLSMILAKWTQLGLYPLIENRNFSKFVINQSAVRENKPRLSPMEVIASLLPLGVVAFIVALIVSVVSPNFNMGFGNVGPDRAASSATAQKSVAPVSVSDTFEAEINLDAQDRTGDLKTEEAKLFLFMREAILERMSVRKSVVFENPLDVIELVKKLNNQPSLAELAAQVRRTGKLTLPTKVKLTNTVAGSKNPFQSVIGGQWLKNMRVGKWGQVLIIGLLVPLVETAGLGRLLDFISAGGSAVYVNQGWVTALASVAMDPISLTLLLFSGAIFAVVHYILRTAQGESPSKNDVTMWFFGGMLFSIPFLMTAFPTAFAVSAGVHILLNFLKFLFESEGDAEKNPTLHRTLSKMPFFSFWGSDSERVAKAMDRNDFGSFLLALGVNSDEVKPGTSLYLSWRAEFQMMRDWILSTHYEFNTDTILLANRQIDKLRALPAPTGGSVMEPLLIDLTPTEIDRALRWIGDVKPIGETVMSSTFEKFASEHGESILSETPPDSPSLRELYGKFQLLILARFLAYGQEFSQEFENSLHIDIRQDLYAALNWAQGKGEFPKADLIETVFPRRGSADLQRVFDEKFKPRLTGEDPMRDFYNAENFTKEDYPLAVLFRTEVELLTSAQESLSEAKNRAQLIAQAWRNAVAKYQWRNPFSAGNVDRSAMASVLQRLGEKMNGSVIPPFLTDNVVYDNGTWSLNSSLTAENDEIQRAIGVLEDPETRWNARDTLAEKIVSDYVAQAESRSGVRPEAGKPVIVDLTNYTKWSGLVQSRVIQSARRLLESGVPVVLVREPQRQVWSTETQIPWGGKAEDGTLIEKEIPFDKLLNPKGNQEIEKLITTQYANPRSAPTPLDGGVSSPIEPTTVPAGFAAEVLTGNAPEQSVVPATAERVFTDAMFPPSAQAILERQTVDLGNFSDMRPESQEMALAVVRAFIRLKVPLLVINGENLMGQWQLTAEESARIVHMKIPNTITSMTAIESRYNRQHTEPLSDVVLTGDSPSITINGRFQTKTFTSLSEAVQKAIENLIAVLKSA